MSVNSVLGRLSNYDHDRKGQPFVLIQTKVAHLLLIPWFCYNKNDQHDIADVENGTLNHSVIFKLFIINQYLPKEEYIYMYTIPKHTCAKSIYIQSKNNKNKKIQSPALFHRISQYLLEIIFELKLKLEF